MFTFVVLRPLLCTQDSSPGANSSACPSQLPSPSPLWLVPWPFSRKHRPEDVCSASTCIARTSPFPFSETTQGFRILCKVTFPEYTPWRRQGENGIVPRWTRGASVIGIMASILTSLHMQTADDLFGTPQGSPRTDKLIDASIQWAEEIMKKIDKRCT